MEQVTLQEVQSLLYDYQDDLSLGDILDINDFLTEKPARPTPFRNIAPVITDQSFEISESYPEGVVFGSVQWSDLNKDDVTTMLKL